jgi:hypothetical protein
MPGHTQVLLTYNKKNAHIRHSGLVFVASGIDEVYHNLSPSMKGAHRLG